MTISLVATGAPIASGGGATLAAPSTLTGVAVGDLLLMWVAAKLDTVTLPTVTGWTKTIDVVTGSGTAGVGTGAHRQALYQRVYDGTETASIALLTTPTAVAIGGVIQAWRSTAGAFSPISFTSGSDTTSNTTVFAPGAVTLADTAGDVVELFVVMSANRSLSGTTLSATGATYGTVTERVDAGTANGNNIRLVVLDAPTTAGPATAVPSSTSTASGTTTGGILYARLREATNSAATITSGSVLAAGGQLTQPAAVTMSSGTTLAYTPPAVLLATLTDDFSGTLALWPVLYGTDTSIVGGRLRLATDAGYSGARSADSYTLQGSSAFARLYPPAAGGSTQANAGMWVEQGTAGTQLGFEVDAVGGLLRMLNRVGYGDANEVTVTYDPAAHAWLRIREAGGTVFWETSPDASTWTNRRTTNASAPGWVAQRASALQFTTHREAGVADYFEVDNVNVAAVPVAAAATITSGSTLTAGATVTQLAVVSMSSSMTLTAAPSVTQPAAVALTSATTLTVTATASRPAAVAMSSGSALTTGSAATATGSATITSGNALTVAVTAAQQAAVTITASSTLTTTTAVTRPAATTLASGSALTVGANAAAAAAANLTSGTALTIAATATRPAASTISSRTDLTLQVIVHRAAAATITTGSTLDIAAQLEQPASIVMATAVDLAVAARAEQLAAILMATGSALEVGTMTVPAKPGRNLILTATVLDSRWTGELADTRLIGSILPSRYAATLEDQ